MRYFIQFIVDSMLLLFLTGCASDSLAMAGRFYYGNSYTNNIEKSRDAALRCLERAETQYKTDNRKLAITYYVFGLIAEKRHSPNIAIDNFDKAYELNHYFFDPLLHKARLLEGQQNFTEALYNYKLVEKLIEKDIEYCDATKFPKDHILFDHHLQYFIFGCMIENSYLRTRIAGYYPYFTDQNMGSELFRPNLVQAKNEISNKIEHLSNVQAGIQQTHRL